MLQSTPVKPESQTQLWLPSIRSRHRPLVHGWALHAGAGVVAGAWVGQTGHTQSSSLSIVIVLFFCLFFLFSSSNTFLNLVFTSVESQFFFSFLILSLHVILTLPGLLKTGKSIDQQNLRMFFFKDLEFIDTSRIFCPYSKVNFATSAFLKPCTLYEEFIYQADTT